MEAKHTPGPWTVSQQPGLRFFIVGNEEILAEVLPEVLPCTWDDVQFANANLIAAAPELLEAAQGIARFDEDGYDAKEFRQTMANLKAAIRKAKGE